MAGEQPRVSRMISETILLEGELKGYDQAVLDARAKLGAEAARIGRLLPEAPQGYQWIYEIQAHHNLMRNQTELRVVAKLRSILK
jgi:hypothetical protein